MSATGRTPRRCGDPPWRVRRWGDRASPPQPANGSGIGDGGLPIPDGAPVHPVSGCELTNPQPAPTGVAAGVRHPPPAAAPDRRAPRDPAAPCPQPSPPLGRPPPAHPHAAPAPRRPATPVAAARSDAAATSRNNEPMTPPRGVSERPAGHGDPHLALAVKAEPSARWVHGEFHPSSPACKPVSLLGNARRRGRMDSAVWVGAAGEDRDG
jgi:hypothetical protein